MSATAADAENLVRLNEDCVAAVVAGDGNEFFMANDSFLFRAFFRPG